MKDVLFHIVIAVSGEKIESPRPDKRDGSISTSRRSNWPLARPKLVRTCPE